MELLLKGSCKSQCVDHMCTNEFIIFKELLKLFLEGFISKFNLKSQINPKEILKNCNGLGLKCTMS